MRVPDLPYRGEDIEMSLLTRRYDGVVQQCRMEQLGQRLQRHGPIAIANIRYGFGRNRLSLVLDDTTALRLKLFWPIATSIIALRSARWREQVGWWIETTTIEGADSHMVAFDIRVER
ncbi:MAG: hypothetical protein ABIR32_07010 [Ilumatobacteraceae bacterium]